MVSKSLVAASARPMILALLKKGESYGYRIMMDVAENSGGAMEWSEAMLYPVLHRLEKEGVIQSCWKVSGENRMRKYYRLTSEGRKELEAEKSQWLSVHAALLKAWRAAEAAD